MLEYAIGFALMRSVCKLIIPQCAKIFSDTKYFTFLQKYYFKLILLNLIYRDFTKNNNLMHYLMPFTVGFLI